jgi:hypothetical protein
MKERTSAAGKTVREERRREEIGFGARRSGEPEQRRTTVKLTIVAAAVAVVMGGLVAAQEKAHKCAMAGILCPKEGKCEGKCREICDRAGEAMDALKSKVAASMKECGCPHLGGTCKESGCETCGSLQKTIYVPVLKAKVTARFGEMGKDVQHEVSVNGKTAKVACTLLTGKLCDPCVDGMKKSALEKIEAMFKEKK